MDILIVENNNELADLLCDLYRAIMRENGIRSKSHRKYKATTNSDGKLLGEA